MIDPTPLRHHDHADPADRRGSEPTIVVGAGLGGLLAAITVADAHPAGRVVVFEPHPAGGRARCDQRDGFTLNRGPRALYIDSIADRTLRAVSVDTSRGGPPVIAGGVAIAAGEVHRFPGGAGDALRTRLFSGREKVAVGRLMAAVLRADDDRLAAVSVNDWLNGRGATGRPRQFVEALIRVSTYANAPDLFAAGPALANTRLGIRPGVRYLDGGWQSLVDQLLAVAADRGVQFLPVGARTVATGPDGAITVQTTDGAIWPADAVIIAGGGPEVAAGLLGRAPDSWGRLGLPVTAACLELGVRRLPPHRFALGIDEPTYASTHAPPADLAPDGQGVVHLMRYQSVGDETDVEVQRAALQRLARTVGIEPADVVTERFLARMVVSGALPTADRGGLAGRPPVAVAEHPGVFLAGDWVGGAGLLLDAVAASATEAGQLAAARSASMVPA